MRKFVLNTDSESGDHYTYFIKHKTEPNYEELERFLEVNANDIEDNVIYEQIVSIIEILDEDFLSIPSKITKKKGKYYE